MSVFIGIALAIAVGVFASTLRLDRGRAFYATVLIVVGSYYVLFAAIGASPRVIAIEVLVMGIFVTAAAIGFRRSDWILVAGLAGHGVFDGFHGYLVVNPGMPEWWPGFCLAYDATAAGYMAWWGRRLGPESSLRP